MSREPSPEDRAAAEHRLLPHSLDAERGLLCSALLRPDEVLDLAAALDPRCLYLPAHQIVWESLQIMQRERKPIDPVTLTVYLADRNLLASAGGAAGVSDLFCFLPTAANAEFYLRTVRDKNILRRLIASAHEITQRAYEEQDQVRDLLEDAVQRMVDIGSEGAGGDHIQPIQPFVLAALNEVELHYATRGRTVGLPTGFTDLDRMIGGWQKGCNYYFGGRPAMGKSSLGLNFGVEVAGAALADGAPTLILSLEMTGTQLAKRLIFTLARINQQRARDGFLSKEKDWKGLMNAAQKLAGSRLFIDESSTLSIAEFRARVRSWVKKMRRQFGERQDGRPDCLVITDFIQRMKGSSKRSEGSRYLELQEISQGMAAAAKDLQIAHIGLAQLGRPKDKKPETEPDMSDFRESGDLEQDAHVVGLIHRPHYYVKHNPDKQEALAAAIRERFQRQARYGCADAKEADAAAAAVQFTPEDLARYAKLLIDKQREGPVGPIDLRFIADYTQFEDWDERPLYSSDPAERQFTAEGEA